MGMFDTIRCEAPLPDGYEVPGRSFQTKSLCCVGDRFTITAQGRLILHRCRHERSAPRGGQSIPRSVPVVDVDTGYHGDIEMHGVTADNKPVDCAARFTHGTLEWIRPLDELDELHRVLLTEKA